MSYSLHLHLLLATCSATPPASAPPAAAATGPTSPEDVVRSACAGLIACVERFRAEPISPSAAARFENELREEGRAVLRRLVEWTYNHLEPATAEELPRQLAFEGDSYRRLPRKTPQVVDTLFGPVRLWRQGYRAAAAAGVPVLFPLCRELGVRHGTTPALCERAARYLAQAGATQQLVLGRLRQEHGVAMGVKRLRELTASVAAALDGHREAAQAERVLGWLGQAQASRGRHRPVLALGRDGITLGLRCKGVSVYEVATAGTLSVYDRRGRRLGTVYLGQVPEPGQGTMSRQLTALLVDVLRRWAGPVPRLCYVTDAGDSETSYYKTCLRRLRHPVTGQRLAWQWVVDYYHVSQRLTAMAEALFGKGPRAWSWMRRMQTLLLKPGGVGRVLHSAAALRSQQRLRGQRLADFRRAYRYLQTRRRYLDYASYRRVGLPVGSGVTEAACKALFAQRLKLSGMRWQKEGAQRILYLRAIWMSGVWSEVFERMFGSQRGQVTTGSPGPQRPRGASKAA